jgi:hypothetical protein
MLSRSSNVDRIGVFAGISPSCPTAGPPPVSIKNRLTIINCSAGVHVEFLLINVGYIRFIVDGVLDRVSEPSSNSIRIGVGYCDRLEIRWLDDAKLFPACN